MCVQRVCNFASREYIYFFLQHNTGATLQKQLLKLKYEVFVYHESDLPLRISIISLSACEPKLTHRTITPCVFAQIR